MGKMINMEWKFLEDEDGDGDRYALGTKTTSHDQDGVQPSGGVFLFALPSCSFFLAFCFLSFGASFCCPLALS